MTVNQTGRTIVSGRGAPAGGQELAGAVQRRTVGNLVKGEPLAAVRHCPSCSAVFMSPVALPKAELVCPRCRHHAAASWFDPPVTLAAGRQP